MDKSTVDLQKTAEFVPTVFGFLLTQIAGTAGRLGIPDILRDGPQSVDELVAATGADPNSLRRLLRTASAMGFLEPVGDDRYDLTGLGWIYCADSPWQATMYDRMHSHRAVWNAFGALEDAVRTGKPSFNIANGAPLFDYLEQDPELASYFHATMATGTAFQVPAIIDNYDFSRFSEIVDLGGGNGTFLAAILSANPNVRGAVFNSAGALVEAPEILRKAGVADRAKVIAGDFFQSVPSGADAYLLKSVIHDWDDESCIAILRTARAAMKPGSRVVILTSVLPESATEAPTPETLAVFIQDIEMMVMCPGSIRTIAEHAQLFEAAGLRLGDVTPLRCPFNFHAVEGLPA